MQYAPLIMHCTLQRCYIDELYALSGDTGENLHSSWLNGIGIHGHVDALECEIVMP